MGIKTVSPDITVLPPAAQGDLLEAVRQLKPSAVGLLDCELPYRDLPTWHKEIIHVLNQGIPVLGASAAGAHRAVELASHGMEGVGSIFRRVASGKLERDDEVFCDWKMTPDGIKKLSIPLITMRDVITAAEAKKIISDECATIMTASAEKLFWKHRTWGNLTEESKKLKADSEEIDKFMLWLDRAPDPVKNDALAMLQRLEKLASQPVQRTQKAEKDEEEISSLFQSLNQRDRPVPSEAGYIRQWHIGDMASLAHPEAEDLNGKALNRKLVLLLASGWNIVPEEIEIEQEVKRIRRRFNLKTDEDLHRWMVENDLDENDFLRLMREEAIVHSLHQWLMQGRIHAKNTGALLDEMKLRGGYSEWKEKAARREKLLQENKEILQEEVDQASQTTFMKILRDHLRCEKFPWYGTILFETLPETGLEGHDLIDELIRARAARRCLSQALAASQD